MPVTVGQIVEKFSSLAQLKFGDPQIEVSSLHSANLATENDLIFAGDKQHLKLAMQSRSEIWCVSDKLFESVVDRKPKVLLASPSVNLAMALIAQRFFRPPHFRDQFGHEGIHPSATIHPSAKIGQNCLIGPCAVIGADSVIGDHSVVGSNSTVAMNVKIGNRTQIHPNVYVGPDVYIGEDCEIHPHSTLGSEGFGFAHDQNFQPHRLTHFGRLIIGDRVHIGASVQIDRGTFEDSIISSDVIIDNHCHFGHNIKIGRGTVITGGMIVAGSVTIGERCVFGGRTTIAGHLTVASDCQFAGLSGIPSTIETAGNYGGYPPQPLKTALKITSSLRHLPEMRKQLHSIMNRLGLPKLGTDEDKAQTHIRKTK